MAFPPIPENTVPPLGQRMAPGESIEDTCYKVTFVLIGKEVMPGGGPPPLLNPVWRINKALTLAGAGIGIDGNIAEKCICADSADFTALSLALLLRGITAGIECTDSACEGYKVKKVCKPCGSLVSGRMNKNCKCTDKKFVDLKNINSDSKQYKASDGSTVTLDSPGDFQKVMEQIISVEEGMPIDCITK